MKFVTRRNVLTGAFAAAGCLVIFGIASGYLAFLQNQQDAREAAATKVKPVLQLAAEPAQGSTPGEVALPYVAVVVKAVSKVSTELGPRLTLQVGKATVAQCPPAERVRVSQSTPATKKVLIETEGAWCFEAEPGQEVRSRKLPGELLDLRSDTFLSADTDVEQVVIKLWDGTSRAVTAAAVSVCDNNGLCAAAAAIEEGPVSDGISLKLPLTSPSDVVVYGPKERIGLVNVSSQHTIASSPALKEMLAPVAAPVPVPPEATPQKEEVPPAQPEAPKSQVFDDGDSAVNTPVAAIAGTARKAL